MAGIGPLELAIVLIIVLVVFGPKRLPGLGKQLGSGMREFKESVTGKDKHDDDDDRPTITPARAAEPLAEDRTSVPTAEETRPRV